MAPTNTGSGPCIPRSRFGSATVDAEGGASSEGEGRPTTTSVRTRLFAVAAVACVALAAAAPSFALTTRGHVRVYDDVRCRGVSSAVRVAVPFGIGITG